MAALIYVVLAVLVHAALPEGQYFDCSANAYKNELDCIATKYCIWNILANPPDTGCIYDPCLKYVAALGDENATACIGTVTEPTGCALYYITDTHNCTDGTVIAQTDLFCRTDNKTNVALHKQSIDECFYQDLQNKSAGGPGKCANIGTISCATKGSGNTSYCAATGEQTCNTYLEDNDLASFCDCLGVDRCNLYPGCATKREGGGCVDDPCFYAASVPGQAKCTGNIPNVGERCGVKDVQQINTQTGELQTGAICVTTSSPSGHAVKVNDYNPCYYGISAKVTYPNWASTPNLQYPECASVDEVNQCEKIVLTAESNCTVANIQSGYFLGAQGHYCTDGQNRNIPSPDSTSILRIPSILLFIAVAFVALL